MVITSCRRCGWVVRSMESLNVKSASDLQYVNFALHLQGVMGSTHGSQPSDSPTGRRMGPGNISLCFKRL
jgi:hypothetical protein